MTTLTYRGKTYEQNNKPSSKEVVELTYRRNIYKKRQLDVSSNKEKTYFNYRGVNYQK